MNKQTGDDNTHQGGGCSLPARHGLLEQDDTETLPDIAEAFLARDWCRFAQLVADAPEIDLAGKASFAMREIAIAAIERLQRDEQFLHLEAVTDYALSAERQANKRGGFER